MYTLCSNIKIAPETNAVSAKHPTTQLLLIPDRRPLRPLTVQTLDGTANAATPCLQPPVCGSAGIKKNACTRKGHAEGQLASEWNVILYVQTLKCFRKTNVLSTNHFTQPTIVPDRRPLRPQTVQ
jgi:hypothetical protein